MIRFTDFLPLPEPSRTKVKFNIRAGNGGPMAWDLLLADDDERWLDMTRYRAKGSTSNDLDAVEYVLAFAQYYPYGPHYYVFGGYFRVERIEPPVSIGSGYTLTPMPLYAEYIKRLIIKLAEPVGQTYLRWYENLDRLAPVVHELAPDTKLGPFPGYHNVRLRHRELQLIFSKDEPSWEEALSSVKGVYVITDLTDGRLYVGSASGEGDGLWQRWSAYAHLKNLTGGNKELVRMRAELGDDHIINNFQYSILEIFDPKTKQGAILQRESFWKLALDSRVHGMNAN